MEKGRKREEKGRRVNGMGWGVRSDKNREALVRGKR